VLASCLVEDEYVGEGGKYKVDYQAENPSNQEETEELSIDVVSGQGAQVCSFTRFKGYERGSWFVLP